MSDNRNIENQKIEAFIKSPAGFWIITIVVGAIVIGAVVTTVMSWFR